MITLDLELAAGAGHNVGVMAVRDMAHFVPNRCHTPAGPSDVCNPLARSRDRRSSRYLLQVVGVYSRIMPRPVRFRKQYKPIGFGDAYDPRSVEGHRNAVHDAIENRRADRELKELEEQHEVETPLHVKAARRNPKALRPARLRLRIHASGRFSERSPRRLFPLSRNHA